MADSSNDVWTMSDMEEMHPNARPSKPRLIIDDSDDSDAPSDITSPAATIPASTYEMGPVHNVLFPNGRIIGMTTEEQLEHERKKAHKEKKKKQRYRQRAMRKLKRKLQSESEEADDEEGVTGLIAMDDGGTRDPYDVPPRPLYFNNSIRPAVVKPESVSLAVFNENIPDIDAPEPQVSVVHYVSEVLKEVDRMPKTLIEEMDQRELKLVEFMNEWCGRLDYVSSEPKVAIRYLKDKTHYAYTEHSISGFKQMFQQCTLSSYNKKDYHNWVNFKDGREVSLPSGGSNKARLNPYMKMKHKDPTDNQSPMVPDFHVKLESYSVAEIWLNHPCLKVYNKTVCNPRPAHFKNAALPYDLNICKYSAIIKPMIMSCEINLFNFGICFGFIDLLAC